MLADPAVESCRVHAGHSVEHGRNPWGIAEIPETEKIMPETSAQEPSLPPAPATVADIMRPPLTTVQPNDHVAGAAYLMRHEAATALVVLDPQTNRPMGLITEADIVQLVADGRDTDAVRIYDLMTTRLSVINATASIRDAANTMITGRFRHLPVVEDAGLIGMIDITDVCRALLDAPGG
jgi:CBS domain-containing protein